MEIRTHVPAQAELKGNGVGANREGSWLKQGGKLRVTTSQRTGQELAAGGAKSCTVRAKVLQHTLRELWWMRLL